MDVNNMTIDYDVVSEFAGHQANKNVPIVEAAKDIFSKVKEKAMQCATGGKFIEFETVDELINGLVDSIRSGLSIRVCDQDIGG